MAPPVLTSRELEVRGQLNAAAALKWNQANTSLILAPGDKADHFPFSSKHQLSHGIPGPCDESHYQLRNSWNSFNYIISYYVPTLIPVNDREPRWRSRYSDWLRAGQPRVRVPVGSRIFTSPHTPALGPTQPTIHWIPEILTPGVKRQGRETDRSPPTSADVRKTWIYSSTPPYVFMAQCSIG
jgi:hypothetical protein